MRRSATALLTLLAVAALPAPARPAAAEGRAFPPATFQAVLAAAAQSPDPCGYGCDGKDPASHPALGKNGHTYLCADDASSPRTRNGGDATVKLRSDPLCRTAWTRGCCYPIFSGVSHYLNGGQRDWVYVNARNTGSRVYTVLLNDADLQYKACYDNQIGGSPEWKCTGKY